MAGFEVIIYGRFWVIAEGRTMRDSSGASGSTLRTDEFAV
jgi:hypothetical protein